MRQLTLGKWRTCKIGSIGRVVTGKTPPTSDSSNFGGAYPFVTIPDLNGRVYIDNTERTLSIKGAESIKSCLLPPGSIMMSCIATVGKCGVTTKPSFTNQQINSVIPNKEVDPRFLYYVFTQIGSQIEAAGGGGSVYINVSKKRFSDIEINIPVDIREQKAIAHILGTLDDKIELNRRMNETLEQMARAIFKSWFVDFEPVQAKMSGRWKKGESLPGLPAHVWDLFPDRLVPSKLGDIPEGWEIKKLSTLCRVQYGYTANAILEPIGPRLLRVTDINKQNWIDWNSVPYCSISDKEKEKYSLKIGDIVVARMADPGKSAIIEEELNAVFASYLVRLKTDSLSIAYYIYGFLKADLYKRYVAETSTGSVQPSMNAKVIVGTNLIVPTISLIESYFDLVLPIRHRIYKNLKESHTLSSIRDTALPKLIGGRIPLNID
jgi:type I restriction enzyme S subunit